MFADNTTVVGLITNNDETAYREEVWALRVWCQENNLSLNVNKTREIIVDFRKQHDHYSTRCHRKGKISSRTSTTRATACSHRSHQKARSVQVRQIWGREAEKQLLSQGHQTAKQKS
jgi:hypothetical protein